MTKVEEIMRAIYRIVTYEGDPLRGGFPPFEEAATDNLEFCEEVALAAIAAMREPTEEMLRGVPDWDRAVWLTMIDAALSSHPSPSIQRGEGK